MNTSLYDELNRYLSEGLYPLHMPGHTRLPGAEGDAAADKHGTLPYPEAFQRLPFEMDVTELPGTDNLHDAKGILRDAMLRTARLYGAACTFYLVGGSTAGILAGLHALVPFGSKILCARNCHKSVYHAAELLHLKIVFLDPPVLPDFEIAGSIPPGTVAAAFSAHPDAAALVLTSPTYEGVVSDIRKIAELCRAAGAKLFVDEAHGAHLGLFEKDYFPESALHLGADLVVQSAHKTLPALTQTAFLHIPSLRGADGAAADPDAVARSLSVFETSSPSYPLLISLDACTAFLRENGRPYFARWRKMLEDFYEETRALRNIRVFRGEGQAVFDFDPSKLLIRSSLEGARLAEILRERFGFETEMHGGNNVLAMTGAADDPAALKKLAQALRTLDGDAFRAGEARACPPPLPAGGFSGPSPVSIYDALHADAESIPLQKAAGRILAEYLCPYPPGIPLLSPGEAIPEALLSHSYFRDLMTVRVLKQTGC